MKRVYFLLSLFFLSLVLNAQDIQFAMPYSSPLYFNPAFAGSSGCGRVTGEYRNQWPNISGNYISSILSIDQYIKKIHGGFGINYFHDGAGLGTVRNNRISGIYSFRIPLFKNKCIIQSAIEGGYAQRTLDWSKLTFGSPQNGFVYGDKLKEVVSYPDFSSGILIYSEKFYGGFAIHHLNEPEESILYNESRLPKQYTAHAGANIRFKNSGKEITLSPSLLYFQQQNYRNLALSCAAQRGLLVLGLRYRNDDNMIGSIGFRVKSFRIAYSYDLTISKLGIVAAGSHELSLSVFFNRKNVPSEFLPFETAAF